MEPYKALYGIRCRSPLVWDEAGEKKLLGLEVVQQTTQSIEKIHKRLVAAQYKQKKYADFGRKEKTFEVGAKKILLKVSPWKGIVRFGKRRNWIQDISEPSRF